MKMWLRLDLSIPANTQTQFEACLNFSNSFLDMFGPGPVQQFGQTVGYGEQFCELPEDWSLLGILPHSHLMGKSWEVYAEAPGGENIPIIKIPDWDFDWQGFFYPEYMQYIPAGSRIKAIAEYDNISNQNMTWGELTTDEMFFCPIYYVPYQEGDENIYLGSQEETFLYESKYLGLKLFPNPANNYIDLSFQLTNDSSVEGYLLDSKGRIISVIFNGNYKSGLNNTILDVKDLDCGIYFIKIHTDNTVLIKRFIKE